jgi:hypothetical protein
LNSVLETLIAFGPETRNTAMAPAPDAVARAIMVSLLVIFKLLTKILILLQTKGVLKFNLFLQKLLSYENYV